MFYGVHQQMKKFSFLLVAGMLAMACHRKSVPTEDIIISNEPAATKPKSTTATTASMNGEAIFEQRCKRCHALPQAAKFTVAEWDNILISMVPKARLDKDAEAKLRTYIKAHAKT